MHDPANNSNMDWSKEEYYPNPDYLSSSRKRLAPQLIYKGGILKAWDKKSAVALNTGFFNTLPHMKEVDEHDADIAWLIYDLEHNAELDRYSITRKAIVYTSFHEALNEITLPRPGIEADFLKVLQNKLDKKLDGTPPDTPTINEFVEGGG